MFLSDILNSGAIPALEATVRFAGQRQRLLAHNIANIDTPDFRPLDVSPAGFQRALSKAIDKRREDSGGMSGGLEIGSTREITQTPSGDLILTPGTNAEGILAQDRNNTDLERLMQDHAENFLVYRVSSELLRSRIAQLRDAIAERV